MGWDGLPVKRDGLFGTANLLASGGRRCRIGPAWRLTTPARTCHSIREGDNRLGPHMRGIIGRKAGSLPNYSYSSAMKGANFVWDEENLERFIANPDETVPGNTMKPYGGLASAESRIKLIALLKTLGADQ